MNAIYDNILASIAKEEKLLAVLIDPDKMILERLPTFIEKLNTSMATHIFVGGSVVDGNVTDLLVEQLQPLSDLPIVLFPGDVSQITDKADALLFLSLISGRDADYLIDKHVQAVPLLKDADLEIIPTGYILIENGKETSVQRVTQTQPMSRDDIPLVTRTALAGQLLGQKLIYLEAGSGATHPVDVAMISDVKQALRIPLIVGGGIKTKVALMNAYDAGADLVVIGTTLENNDAFFNELR